MADDTDDVDDQDSNAIDEDRINRVRGKRDSRRSRRSKQTPRATDDTQGKQETQMQESPQAPQVSQSDKENRKQEIPQAAQGTQSQEATQSPEDKLEPVTQRSHDTFYLDDAVRNELNKTYRRVALELLEEADVDLDDRAIGGRNRYFRPMALLLGARELRSMSSDELREAIESEDLVDDLPNAE